MNTSPTKEQVKARHESLKVAKANSYFMRLNAELQRENARLAERIEDSYDLIYEAIEYVSEIGRYGASDLVKRMRELLP